MIMSRDVCVNSLESVLQGNKGRCSSDGDGTETSSRPQASVSNLTQVCLLGIHTWPVLIVDSSVPISHALFEFPSEF